MDLTRFIQDQIRTKGPISLADYMGHALTHPELGYYMTRDPFGAEGDFTTAPEMTQAFGELLGLWAVEMWKSLGSPHPFILCELGPGRGTLMKDALRAAALVPEFATAVQVYLIEASPVLKQRQQAALATHPVTWIARAEELPDLPVIFLANEFFDALPIRQFEFSQNRWMERYVGLDAAEPFAFVLNPASDGPSFGGYEGMVVETCPLAVEIANAMARKVVHNKGAALIIDYGDDDIVGETLQAVNAHRAVPPLLHPGTADLTAHVSFEPMRTAVRKIGTRTFGLVEQADFLLALGLAERTEQLCQKATPEQARTLRAALHRLTDKSTPSAMGKLFKAFAFTNREGATPPGF